MDLGYANPRRRSTPIARSQPRRGWLQRQVDPIGLQFVGPMFGDALVLRAARAYEQMRPIARPKLEV